MAAEEPEDAARQPTFDRELFLWLGDEPLSIRAADAGRIRDIAAEFALGFDRLAQIGPAVTVFGWACTRLSIRTTRSCGSWAQNSDARATR